MSEEEKRVTLSIQDHIAHVQFNRPEKLNALDLKMFQEIIAVGKELMIQEKVRAVVLSGKGRAFCAGLDLKGAPEIMPVAFEKDEDALCNFVQKVSYQWKQISVPVICALQGVTYGGGLQIALGADIRLAADDTVMSVREIKLGLIPDMGISQTLRNLVSMDQAKELTFTGRDVNAEEALRLGLITRIEKNPIEAALSLAEEISRHSPLAMKAVKKLYEQTWDLGVQESFAIEEKLQKTLLGGKQQMEAMMALLEKRSAQFG